MNFTAKVTVWRALHANDVVSLFYNNHEVARANDNS